jgi:hypothetical protein
MPNRMCHEQQRPDSSPAAVSTRSSGSWRDVINDDCVLCQHLYRDDNVVLGVVMRYYEDGPTYAWWPQLRRPGDE